MDCGAIYLFMSIFPILLVVVLLQNVSVHNMNITTNIISFTFCSFEILCPRELKILVHYYIYF